MLSHPFTHPSRRARCAVRVTGLFWICLAIAGCEGDSSSATRTPNPPPSLASSTGNSSKVGSSPQLAKAFDFSQKKAAGNLTKRATVSSASGTIAGPIFTEQSESAVAQHVYVTGPTELKLMVQPVGGGCGWVDYDGDGLWDLYLNQAGDPSLPRSKDQPTDQLFRNLGDGQFRLATLHAGIDERDYSQGVAVGDFDNDGFDDIFVTNVSAVDTLFHNQGDGTYLDVTDRFPRQEKLWSSSAAWGDIDRDGDLDLYVAHYVAFDRFHPVECRTTKGERKMCQPNDVPPAADEFFLNAGDGTFQPVARERGLYGADNKALGVAFADFDNDGWSDFYVANDATPAYLFINQHDGHFVNKADLMGCALSLEGRAQAGMGIAVGDYDRNGYLDLYLTHFEGEWNTLYQNLGPKGFSDVTGSARGVEVTMPMVGWGTVMEDFNQDGAEDLIMANGHLDDPGHLGVELAMPSQLFTFVNGQIVDCSQKGGSYFSRKKIGRGLATADYDNDGDLDVVIVNQDSPAALLKNESARGHWLKLQFTGRHSNRHGIGTRVTLRMGKDVFMKELAGGTSYCVSNQPVLVFGLGERAGTCELEIRWPDGRIQHVKDVALDQQLDLLEPLPAGAG